MLESKYSKILLSNYQWSSSTLIDKYTSDFNKIIIDGFISNVKSFKKVFNFIFKSKKIKLNKLDFNNDKHINEVLNLLKELCFTSANDLSIYRLFDSKYIDSKTIYEITFSKIISNYHKNKFIIN